MDVIIVVDGDGRCERVCVDAGGVGDDCDGGGGVDGDDIVDDGNDDDAEVDEGVGERHVGYNDGVR